MPTLEITSPLPGATPSPPFTVTGTTDLPPGTVITVTGGANAVVGPDGTWTTTVTLPLSPPPRTVTAAGPGGSPSDSVTVTVINSTVGPGGP